MACFYELDKQLIIHPDECIDLYGLCRSCPVHAIYAEAELPAEFAKDTEFNTTQAAADEGLGREGDHSEGRRCPARWSAKSARLLKSAKGVFRCSKMRRQAY